MKRTKNIVAKSFVPPEDVAKAAAYGLELHNRFHEGGTKVGWARARQLENRENVNNKDVNKMFSYFARHEIDKQAENFGNDKDPSKGYIAWLLWGGDAGQKWVKSLKSKLND